MWGIPTGLFCIAFFHRAAPGVIARRPLGGRGRGRRVYPAEAYAAGFGLCTLLVLASTAATLFLRETRGENVYQDSRG
jgi:hypothetical protein